MDHSTFPDTSRKPLCEVVSEITEITATGVVRDREIWDINTHWEAMEAFNKANRDEFIILKARMKAAKGQHKSLIVSREWAARAYRWYRKVNPTFTRRHISYKTRLVEAFGNGSW